MPQEIERKFLVSEDILSVLEGKEHSEIIQGYLSRSSDCTVRIRLDGDHGFVTIKGKTQGISRAEYEYSIPAEDAKNMLAMCKESLIEKTRYKVIHEGSTWEVDVFHGDNQGLIVSEIELESEGSEFSRPDWLRKEVSHDGRYFNSNLSVYPYSKW